MLKHRAHGYFGGGRCLGKNTKSKRQLGQLLEFVLHGRKRRMGKATDWIFVLGNLIVVVI